MSDGVTSEVLGLRLVRTLAAVCRRGAVPPARESGCFPV